MKTDLIRLSLRHGLILLALWGCQAGANHALRFERGDQAVELPLGPAIVADDAGPRFRAEPPGAWTATDEAGTWGVGARRTSDPAAVATWTPALPNAGSYEVSAWWVAASTDAEPGGAEGENRFVVLHADGATEVGLDQQTMAEGWNSLGTFRFKGDPDECVVLRPGTPDAPPVCADAIRFENRASFDNLEAMTVEAWVRIDEFLLPNRAIVTKGDAWGLRRYGETDRLTFRTRDGQQFEDLVSGEPLLPNVWHHVAAVWDGTEKRLYVDGALSVSAPFSKSWPTSAEPVSLGGDLDAAAGDGGRLDLDQVRIWSAAREGEALSANRLRHLRGSENGLLGEWRFEGMNPAEVIDSGRLGLHGRVPSGQSLPNRVATSGLVFKPPAAGQHALEFHGLNQGVAAVGRGLDLAEGLTVEVWVRVDYQPEREMVLVSKGLNSWELSVVAGGKIVFKTAGLTADDPTGAGQPEVELRSQARLDVGEWHHVAATWDPQEGRKEILIDGRPDAAVTGLRGTVAVDSADLRFAARAAPKDLQMCLVGALDEVRLWDEPRSSREIAEFRGRRLHGLERGLLSRWSFDEGSGSLALDSGPRNPPSDGLLVGGIAGFQRIAGVALREPLPAQYCLFLEGSEAHVQVSSSTSVAFENLTIEAWVKPLGTGLRPVLSLGDFGGGLAIDADNHLRYFVDATTQNALRSDRGLDAERGPDGAVLVDADGLPVVAWNHVAVVVDQSAGSTTFYINGRPAGTRPVSVIPIGSGPLTLGKRGTGGATVYYHGLLDEVRLWNVPRSELELALYAFSPILDAPAPESLIAYWRFNEGRGAAAHDDSGHEANGELIGMSAAAWRDGTDWGVPEPPATVAGLRPNPDARGLWIGRVSLNRVNEVQSAAPGVDDQVPPTADEASIRILFHVADDGLVRLLKDVILMRKAATTPLPSGAGPLPAAEVSVADERLLVLVTRPELIQNYEGVSRRGGRMVGLRYGSVAYDFEGRELPVLGGLGPGVSCLGRIHLPKDHPTNPYRHKYHPDHRSGFDITRQFTIEFDGAPSDPFSAAPGYGVDRLTGVYRETVAGLHKIPLHVEGTVELNRVTTLGVLNQ